MQLSDLLNEDLVLLYTHNKGSNKAIDDLIIERLPTFRNSLLMMALEAVCYSKNHVLKIYSMLKRRQNIDIVDIMRISENLFLEDFTSLYNIEALTLSTNQKDHKITTNKKFDTLRSSNKLDIADYYTLCIYGATAHIQLTSFEEYCRTTELDSMDIYQVCLHSKNEDIVSKAFMIYKSQRLYSYETLSDLMQNARLKIIRAKSKQVYKENIEYYKFIESLLCYSIIASQEVSHIK
jgi:hypothetical protein